MQIIAAIEYDRLRQEPGTWNKVILHREGKFYRAYEWSAWLIKTVVCTEAFQKERGYSEVSTPCSVCWHIMILTDCGTNYSTPMPFIVSATSTAT